VVCETAEGWSVSGVGGEWGGVDGLGDWCGVLEWGGVDGLDGNWGYGLDGDWGGPVDNGVESVDGVSGVLDGPDGTIWLNKGVASLDNITISALLMGLGVTGQTILDGVSVAVLGMWVVFLSNNGLLEYWGGDLGYWCGVVEWGGVHGLGDWGGVLEWGVLGVGQWGGSQVSGVSQWGTSLGSGQNGGEAQNLVHGAELS
jgi:hypothetical protein